mgnify:CR=1 FL=1
MTPEELQKEFFRLFNASMKNPVWDKTVATTKDMDDFMRLNLMKYLEYSDPTKWGGGKDNTSAGTKLGLDDRNRIANSLRIIKRELAEIERLVGPGDDSGV